MYLFVVVREMLRCFWKREIISFNNTIVRLGRIGWFSNHGWISGVNFWDREGQVMPHTDKILCVWFLGYDRNVNFESFTSSRVNCSFYFKIGACRHGDRCSRIHNKPTFSQVRNLHILCINLHIAMFMFGSIFAKGIYRPIYFIKTAKTILVYGSKYIIPWYKILY